MIITDKNRYKPITFVELKKMSTKYLLFRLKQNRDNMKGIGEYLRRFGVKKKRNSKGLSAKDIVEMLMFIDKNVNVILDRGVRK